MWNNILQIDVSSLVTVINPESRVKSVFGVIILLFFSYMH